MFNLTMLTSSFISVVFCCNQRCLFDYNRTTRLIRTLSMAPLGFVSTVTSYKEIRAPEFEKFLIVESGILGLESRIQLKESRIPLTIGIQNPRSIDKYWNPVPRIWNPRPGMQNPRLSWPPLQGATTGFDCNYN